jgi:hypothetical protein
MFVVMNLKSKCGSSFEAHIAYRPGPGCMISTTCPDCGELWDIPDQLVRPLIRLQ